MVRGGLMSGLIIVVTIVIIIYYIIIIIYHIVIIVYKYSWCIIIVIIVAVFVVSFALSFLSHLMLNKTVDKYSQSILTSIPILLTLKQYQRSIFITLTSNWNAIIPTTNSLLVDKNLNKMITASEINVKHFITFKTINNTLFHDNLAVVINMINSDIHTIQIINEKSTNVNGNDNTEKEKLRTASL